MLDSRASSGGSDLGIEVDADTRRPTEKEAREHGGAGFSRMRAPLYRLLSIAENRHLRLCDHN
jgi:hypothetical protein